MEWVIGGGGWADFDQVRHLEVVAAEEGDYLAGAEGLEQMDFDRLLAGRPR